MTHQYVVTLKNQHTRTINLFGLFLSLLSLFLFTRELFNPDHYSMACLAGSIGIIIILCWNLYQFKVLGRKVMFNRALLLAALVWMKMPYLQGLSILYIILALLEHQAKYNVEMGFSENGILVNTLFKRNYHWDQFQAILLKDGLLTLDFADNRFWQREVADDEDDDADEDEFNDWCRKMISNHSKKP
ncbi:MAG: hypothetical protein RL732_505 [Bacteroidota bacterium]